MKLSTVGEMVGTRKITLLLYGQPKLGKTSLIKTLPYKPEEILYVAADPGQLALMPLSEDKIKRDGLPAWLGRDMSAMPIISPKTKDDFQATVEYIRGEGSRRFKIVVIDGLDEVGEDCLRLFKELQRQKGARANMQAAYGDMADAMEWMVKSIQDAPIASLFISHLGEAEQSDIQYGPLFPGKKFTEKLYGMFDEIICYRIGSRRPDAKPERLLQCTRNQSPLYMAGDRSGKLDDFEEPDLGKLMAKIFGK